VPGARNGVVMVRKATASSAKGKGK
jgi:hypothetical protein